MIENRAGLFLPTLYFTEGCFSAEKLRFQFIVFFSTLTFSPKLGKHSNSACSVIRMLRL